MQLKMNPNSPFFFFFFESNSLVNPKLINNPEKPNLDAVHLAMAGLKQVKDILCGNLPYEPKVLQINNTAYNDAAQFRKAYSILFLTFLLLFFYFSFSFLLLFFFFSYSFLFSSFSFS